jgi:hypothetical protein
VALRAAVAAQQARAIHCPSPRYTTNMAEVTLLVGWNPRNRSSPFEVRIESLTENRPIIVGKFATYAEAVDNGLSAMREAIQRFNPEVDTDRLMPPGIPFSGVQ